MIVSSYWKGVKQDLIARTTSFKCVCFVPSSYCLVTALLCKLSAHVVTSKPIKLAKDKSNFHKGYF